MENKAPQKTIKGTVKSSAFVKEAYTPHGVLQVYNYELKEYNGLLQARHKGHPIANDSKVVFEFKFADNKNRIAIGSLSRLETYNKSQEKKRDREKEAQFVKDTWQSRAAALDSAIRTPGIKDEEEAIVLATRYLEWILDVDLDNLNGI